VVRSRCIVDQKEMQACQCRLGGGVSNCVYLVSSFQSSTQFRSTTTTMFGAFWFSLLVTEYVFMAMLVSFRWRLYVIGSATTFIMFQIYESFCVFLDSIENVKSNNG
jgi:hypothetical protein